MKRADGRAQRTRLARKVVAAVAVLVAGIVIAVTVVDISGRSDASPTTAPAEPESGAILTAAGESLTDGATVPAAGFSPITVQAAGASVTEVKCVVDGVYLGASNTAPYRFDVASPAAGEHKLRCTLQDGAGAGSDVRVNFTVGRRVTRDEQRFGQPRSPRQVRCLRPARQARRLPQVRPRPDRSATRSWCPTPPACKRRCWPLARG